MKAVEFSVGGKKIGKDNPCFIIAEAGINHNGSFENALKLINAAKESGCDAVKFQTFKAERLYSKKAGNIEFNKLNYPIYKKVKSFELPLEWVPKLKKYCRERKIVFLSSVCDEDSSDVIEKYVDAFKLTSYAINHPNLQRHIAEKRKPIIFSTGGANLEEVKRAYNNVKKYNKKIAILQCVIKYPCPLEYANVGVIGTLKKEFPNAIIGYSDHTLDPVKVPSAAIAIGAKILEKHITLNKKMKGPDHDFALEPNELKQMVKSIRKTETKIKKGETVEIDSIILGSGKKKTEEIEKYLRDFAYRVIFAKRKIKTGEKLTRDNTIILRKAHFKGGLEPKYYNNIMGKTASKDIESHTPIKKQDIKKNIVTIIQARTGSTRLKNKILMKIKNKTIIEWVVYRLRKSRKLDNIVIATSTKKENKKIVSIAKRLKVDFFVGSEDDVLRRVYNAAKKFNADIVVRITADEPLIDPMIVDDIIKDHLKNKAQYSTTTLKRTFPQGVDVEVIGIGCLEELKRLAKTKYDREHVTSYIHRNKNKFRTNSFEAKELKRNYILTIDEPEDFQFVKGIARNFKGLEFYTRDIIKFLDKRIAIRADGSNKGGLGHIHRCLILAKELKKQGFVVFFITQDLDNTIQSIKEQGFEVIKIKKGLDEKQRARKLIEILKIKRPSLLITDLIEIRYDFSSKLKEIGTRAIVLDILGKINLNPEVIINRSIIKKRYASYGLKQKTFLGADYEIFNKDFQGLYGRRRKINRNVKNVLVTLGGSDPKNLCPRVIEALDTLGLNVDVIVGSAYKNIKQINSVLKETKGNFKAFYDVRNMAKFMLKSDIAITAGGKTLYELAVTGTPALVCCEVPHQGENANAFEEKNAVISLGMCPNKDKIREAVIELSKDYRKRQLMSKAGRKITDGEGLNRIVNIIKKRAIMEEKDKIVKEIILKENKFDYDIFKKHIARMRINLSSVDGEMMDTALLSAKKNNADFIFTEADEKNKKTIKILKKSGFSEICTNILFRFQKQRKLSSIKTKMIIRKCKKRDIGQIKNIAKKTYTASHFSLDENFKNTVPLLYEKWAENDCKKGNGFVALENKEIVAFVSYSKTKRGNKKIANIALVRVAKNRQGRGIGNLLLNFSLRKLRDFDEIYVGTAEDNASAVHLYKKNNFKVIRRNVVFHRKC